MGPFGLGWPARDSGLSCWAIFGDPSWCAFPGGSFSFLAVDSITEVCDPLCRRAFFCLWFGGGTFCMGLLLAEVSGGWMDEWWGCSVGSEGF